MCMGPGVHMSSAHEEREEQRRKAASSIRPGWAPLALSQWKPKKFKPKLEHLKAEAEARNKAVPNFRTTQEYVSWLSLNGPDEDGTGATDVCENMTIFDEEKGSPTRRNKLGAQACKPTRVLVFSRERPFSIVFSFISGRFYV